MTGDEIREAAARIRWFHTIDLGHGVITPGVDDTPRKLATIGLPPDLSGKSVLDIGAWDGFFSFEAERRGAARVVALDSYCWNGAGWGTKAGFELARRARNSKVEDINLEVLDITPERAGMFDIVFFLGVLYHLRHPLLALERVRSVTRERLILETEVDLLGLREPAMAFYPAGELNRDTTNWWAPNPAALSGMLRAAGFGRIEIVRPPRGLPRRCAKALKQMVREHKAFGREIWRDRMVVHAFPE